MTTNASALRKNVSALERAITAAVKQGVEILRVSDSSGEPIENGGYTEDSTIRFIGLSRPKQSVVIRDYFQRVIEVVADANGAWSAEAKNQGTGVHEFRAIDGADTSSPWAVEVGGAASGVHIESVTDTQGNLVPHGGTTTDTVLVLEGQVSEVGAELEVLDDFVSKGWVAPGVDGEFQFQVDSLSRGYHFFRLVSHKNEVSEPYVIEVIGGVEPTIDRVTENDQNGAEVSDGGITFAKTLSFVGRAKPSETFSLYDNGVIAYQGNVAPDQHFSAIARDLTSESHVFVVQVGGESASWTVEVMDMTRKPN